MKKTYIAWLVGIIIILALVVWLFSRSSTTSVSLSNQESTSTTQASNTPATSQTQSTAPAQTSSSAVKVKATITISNFSFSPQNLTVKAGTTVTWVNKDSTAHTVTGNNGGPTSPVLGVGSTYSYKFSTPGIYGYHCSIHPMMTGVVVVQ